MWKASEKYRLCFICLQSLSKWLSDNGICDILSLITQDSINALPDLGIFELELEFSMPTNNEPTDRARLTMKIFKVIVALLMMTATALPRRMPDADASAGDRTGQRLESGNQPASGEPDACPEAGARRSSTGRGRRTPGDSREGSESTKHSTAGATRTPRVEEGDPTEAAVSKKR